MVRLTGSIQAEERQKKLVICFQPSSVGGKKMAKASRSSEPSTLSAHTLTEDSLASVRSESSEGLVS